MTPIFLDIEQILHIHKSMIDQYGGGMGIRDAGLLHSAIAMPMASFGGGFLHADIFEMAAAYLFHIIQNHPFIDGNKRVGTAAAIIFLAVNDIQIHNNNDALVDMALKVATGNAGKMEIAEFFRKLTITQ